jgi:hypothetical protein
MRFSERYGFKPVREVLQVESTDAPLRNSLWNVFHNTILTRFQESRVDLFYRVLWMHYYKKPMDEIPDGW